MVVLHRQARRRALMTTGHHGPGKAIEYCQRWARRPLTTLSRPS